MNFQKRKVNNSDAFTPSPFKKNIKRRRLNENFRNENSDESCIKSFIFYGLENLTRGMLIYCAFKIIEHKQQCRISIFIIYLPQHKRRRAIGKYHIFRKLLNVI